MFISCEETKTLMKTRQAQLVDVRTPEEFTMSNLPSSVNVPLNELEHLANSKIDKDRPVVVFCHSGRRSHMAMQVLMAMGYAEVYNMGPFMAWFQCPDVA